MRRRPRILAVVLLLLAVIAAVAGRDAIWGTAKQVLSDVALRQRARERVPETPFAYLALSQVGYPPAHRKEFTSPRPFAGFRVLRDDGSVALTGGAPVRAVDSDRLGDLRRVFIGDFSALTAPGRYHVVLDDGLASHPFTVGAEVFDAPLRAVQRAFYYQRAFTAIEARYAEGPWVHASDAQLAPPGEEKGWHDAGDYSIYNLTAVSALFYLLEAHLDFQPQDDDFGIPESGNGVPDLLDEARWELSWMLSVQEPSGGFRNTTCQEGYGRYGFNLPESMPPYRSGEVGTMPTGRAAATLARAAYAFRTVDPGFADRCLQAALRGYAYLAARPAEDSDGPTCPATRQDADPEGGKEMRMYAAAALLLATGDARYERDFEEHYVDPDRDPAYRSSAVFAAYTYLRVPGEDTPLRARIRGVLRRQADRVLKDAAADPFGRAGRNFWGSIAGGLHRTLFSAKECLRDHASADCEQPLANLHHAFGRNYLQMCFVSGLPGVTRGRQHGHHQWLAALRATPYLFPGLVAGGPLDHPVTADVSSPSGWPRPQWGYFGDPAFPRDERTPLEGRYTDNDSWSANELDVDWQAVATYALQFARREAHAPPVVQARE